VTGYSTSEQEHSSPLDRFDADRNRVRAAIEATLGDHLRVTGREDPRPKSGNVVRHGPAGAPDEDGCPVRGISGVERGI